MTSQVVYIHVGAGQGYLDMVEFLLRHGAEVNAPCGARQSPLHTAARLPVSVLPPRTHPHQPAPAHWGPLWLCMWTDTKRMMWAPR